MRWPRPGLVLLLFARAEQSLENDPQLIEIEGLGQVIMGALFECLDRGFDR